MSEDVSGEVIKKTQKYLGKHVKKPVLTEKLLKKPPFRFLHDVIVAVIKETGFLKGLYTEKELISENVKDKEAKIAFLTKLIEAVKTLTKTDLKAKPSKIVAGLEATETNVLLQTIGHAVDKKIDSSEYVNKFNSGQIPVTAEKKKAKKAEVKNPKENLKQDKPTKESRKKATPAETPKSTDRSKSKVRSKDGSRDRHDSKTKSKTRRESKEKIETDEKGKAETKGELHKQTSDDIKNSLNSTLDSQLDHASSKINSDYNEAIKEEEIVDKHMKINAIEDNEINDLLLNNRDESTGYSHDSLLNGKTANENDASHSEEKHEGNDHNEEEKDAVHKEEVKIGRRPSASLVRPKSARPKSGEIKQKTLPAKIATSEEPALPEPIQKAPRPSSSLRPPSVRPSSARPGAPRLRPESALPLEEAVQMGKINVIVESFDKDADDEETVVIQNSPDTVEPHDEIIDIPLENKGHLVEQILEQINETSGDGRRPKIEIDWDRDSFRGKDATAKELKELRALIQTLTKTANPLGKLLNYLHEDVEAMHNELETWTNTKRQLLREITKQKRISEEASQPLLQHLETLSQEIKKQEQEILTVRSNILRNEIRIKDLLTK